MLIDICSVQTVTKIQPQSLFTVDETMTSQNSNTSQLPIPVESISKKPEDHYLVPPIVISGETETKYQYFSLHDTAKLFDNKS